MRKWREEGEEEEAGRAMMWGAHIQDECGLPGEAVRDGSGLRKTHLTLSG